MAVLRGGPETCRYREPLPIAGATGEASCGLARSILGAAAPPVPESACRACRGLAEPTERRPNAVVASLVARGAEGIASRGGVPGIDPGRAETIRNWAHRHLPMVDPDGPPAPASVALVITCRDYAQYLAEAIESALAQTNPPAEILVVDDSSVDATPEVAARYRGRGVGYLRVEAGSAYRARAAGFRATSAEVVCFLDADDVLPPDYLERGLPLLADPGVGIVYSDIRLFGERTGLRLHPDFDPAELELRNYIHAGSLARRIALDVADVFGKPNLAGAYEDWLVWRRVVDAGWRAVRQPATYLYRIHTKVRPSRTDLMPRSYYDQAGLALAEVTIVTPLSGRRRFWPRHAAWLDAQGWPRDLCRLLLLDSSADPAFAAEVRGYLARSAYPDTRYVALPGADPGLADRPRREHAGAVRLACARIYNKMAREVVTPFVLVVEDDIVPPVGVIDRLLRLMDGGTMAAVAPYRSRFHPGFVAWDDSGRNYLEGEGTHPIGGAGFGCILIRRAALLRETFRHGFGESPDFDRAFSTRLRRDGWTIRVDWSLECLHGDGP